MTIKTLFNILLLVLFLTGCYYLISEKLKELIELYLLYYFLAY